MTEKHGMSAPKMTRVTVRVPRTTLDQINDWVDTLGVRRSHFLGIALVAGVRSLIQASALEVSVPLGALPLDSEPPAQTATSSAASSATSTDAEALEQTVDALKSEVAALRAEIVELKVQLQTEKTASRKHP